MPSLFEQTFYRTAQALKTRKESMRSGLKRIKTKFGRPTVNIGGTEIRIIPSAKENDAGQDNHTEEDNDFEQEIPTGQENLLDNRMRQEM